jgi:hypothetical protein
VDDEGRLPIEQELRHRLEAFDPREGAELLRVLELSDTDRAVQISRFFTRRG